MLEKIGLPERPSMRGNNWVVDASHCQSCSSHFTFINRKHHCRRCGGLFCNTCTQQRMYLRGQGDSAVRICDPCKKLEEAARFELRQGHKKKAGRGSSRLTSTNEDEVLAQILGSDRKDTSSLQRDASNASSSSLLDIGAQNVEDDKIISIETENTTPEELRKQALEEKQNHKKLKAEGKPEEALRAFKRGKELERQAGALELSLRKSRRQALSSINTVEIQSNDDESSPPGRKTISKPNKGKDKDDLSNELKELGWSELDLRDAEKKPAAVSLESELFTLLGEGSQKTSTGKASGGIDKTQVVALKKRALTLKREGKLAEAKEELKKAKILEKQLEEQEFLAGADDSDDELSALMHSLDNDDKQDNSLIDIDIGRDLNFDQLLSDDLGVAGNFEVTDEDMYNPEIKAALKFLGWDDDESEKADHSEGKQALHDKIQSLKREAVNQKRAGNAVEAMELLKKAKLLEKDLDTNPSKAVEIPNEQYEDGIKDVNVIAVTEAKSTPKTRLMIQKELLSIKKKALALRREGKSAEADEELQKGKILEQQLEEMDNNAPKAKAKPVRVNHKLEKVIIISDTGDEVAEDVTEYDMNDPAYLGLLKSLGWDDEDDKIIPVQKIDSSSAQASSSQPIGEPKRTRLEIQKELLGLKRKALTLRRQGQTEEADETLNMAKVLEAQLEEMEVPKKNAKFEFEEHFENNSFSSVHENDVIKGDEKDSTTEENKQNPVIRIEKPLNEQREEIAPKNENPANESDTIQSNVSTKDQSSLKQQILTLKRNALALKKEGKLTEAKEELRRAKLLEKKFEENISDPGTSSSGDASSSTPNVASVKKHENSNSPNSISKPLGARDRFKLQQESLGHKRLSRKLRMEGRNEEADAEFQLAKQIESLLDESADTSSGSGSKTVDDDVGVEDFLDPQLLSALNALGINDTKSQSIDRVEPVKTVAVKAESSGNERVKLEEQIKAEKVKAVTLKRSGKQAEALDALRRAKMFEKKLNSLS